MICWVSSDSNAETNLQKKTRTRLKAYYEKQSNNEKKILIVLFKGSGKSMAGIQNAEVLLSTFNLDEEIYLASVYTDSNGEAVLIIAPGFKFSTDEKGYIAIQATYIGNDSLAASKKQIKFIDLNVDVSFKVIDSVNQVIVSSYKIDSVGDKIPVEGVKLNIGVERLYSTLYLQKIETGKDGTANMEFPDDIPGDSTGIINVIVKLMEHRTYGTITKSGEINWGTIIDHPNILSSRSLFGDQAPLWMTITIFIILTGAWFNFILAITKVLKIKKLDPEQIDHRKDITKL